MVRRTIAVLLILTVAACTTMGPVAAPADYIATERPSRIWITRADDQVIVVEAPRLLGDTLVGFVQGSYREMLLSEAKQVAVTRPAGARTAVVVGGVVAVGAVLIALLASTGPHSPLPTPEDPPTAPPNPLHP